MSDFLNGLLDTNDYAMVGSICYALCGIAHAMHYVVCICIPDVVCICITHDHLTMWCAFWTMCYAFLKSIPHGCKRQPSDCVVCGAILHKLGDQQCHTRPNMLLHTTWHILNAIATFAITIHMQHSLHLNTSFQLLQH